MRDSASHGLRGRRAGTWLLALVLIAETLTPTGLRAQVEQPELPARPLDDDEIEAFLRTARIVARRRVPSGVTMTVRATLSDGALTHDAQIQQVDITETLFAAGKASETNFRDSYQFNIAGYRLARLLGMDNVPVSVPRLVDGKPAAVTWWIDDVEMDEKTRAERQVSGPMPLRTVNQLLNMRVFDELIQNRDRNGGNALWTRHWKLWLIDHTRAFRLGRELVSPDRLARVDRRLLDRLRRLRGEDIIATLTKDRVVTSAQATAVVERRDRLVRHFESRIEQSGEPAVVFSLE